MKDLKKSIQNVEGKYVSAEVLSEHDKETTYGGAVSKGILIAYGVPTTKPTTTVAAKVTTKTTVKPTLKPTVKPTFTTMYGIPNMKK